MEPRIASVSHVSGYTLFLVFESGEAATVDFTERLRDPMFEALQDHAIFATARHDPAEGTVVWINGTSLTREFLSDLLRRLRKTSAGENELADRLLALAGNVGNVSALKDKIGVLWRATFRGFSAVVDTDDRQISLIEARRQTYIYPDYAELVGQPDTWHYTSSSVGGLWNAGVCAARAAELLLLCAFQWRGVWIARADYMSLGSYGGLHGGSEGDEPGWLVCIDPRFNPSNRLGAWYLSGGQTPRRGIIKTQWRKHPRSRNECEHVMFAPFHRLKTIRLENYILDRAGISGKARFRDGNPFNCSPENLEPARGRPMRCARCNRLTSPASSRIIREADGRPRRYCRQCLEGG